jgi:hypothetical protein
MPEVGDTPYISPNRGTSEENENKILVAKFITA